MAGAKPRARSDRTTADGFTHEERAAMREAIRERRARPAGSGDGEKDVLAKIGEMRGSDRTMATRIHALVKAHAPGLSPRTWYGMPAYTRDGQVLCFFRCAAKFKTRYATLGFSDAATLDDGPMWPTDFALTEITPAEEARIVALLQRALG
jgi:uncharacterized protein YdhG (YjbR/CyaY superfamily)